MKVHPAAALLPEMLQEEYSELRDDIARQGQRVPVVLDGQQRILDGRHRARACEELGLEVLHEWFAGEDPIGFVLSANVHRRHLTASQRGAIAVEAEAMYAAEAKARQKAGKKDLGPDRDGGRALDKAASVVGASRTTAAKAKRVKDADPAAFEQIKAGAVSADAAEKQVVAKTAYAKAIEEFPELGPDQSPGLPESEAIKVAGDLRAIPEGPEREMRRKAAATWHKVVAKRNEANEPSAYDHAADIVKAVGVMTLALEKHGGAEWLEKGYPLAQSFEQSVWTDTLVIAHKQLGELVAVCKPGLRRVQ